MTDFSPAFLGMFESLRMGPTFARGRRDERAGHVRSLTVSGSLVVALVRGPDDPTAFRARIAVRAFGASDWARVEKTLVGEARYAADLLDGRMPPGIEAVFAEAGLGLLPLSLDEVAMDCTCERWPMPCIHLAATCYALARAFESDPFEVFTWRGRPRDELLMRLRRLREASAADASRAGRSGTGAPPGAGPGPEEWREAGHRAARSGSPGDAAGDGSPATGGHDQARGGEAAPVAAADPATFWGDDAAGRGPGPHEPATGGSGAWPAGLGVTTDGGGSKIRPDALLDQLDAPGLTHEGRPITEVLRVAYLALPESPDIR